MAEYRPRSLYRLSAADPSTGYEGEMIFNTTDNTLKVYYNGAWNTVNFGLGSGVDNLLIGNNENLLIGSAEVLLV